MSLRDQVAKFFAKPKETPRRAMERAAATPEDLKIARAEKQQQLREFEQRKAASFKEDLARERQKAALEHPHPELRPDGATTNKTAHRIEADAHKALQARTAAEREEIDQRPLRRFVADAKSREQAEQQVSGREAAGLNQKPDRQSPTEVRERESPEPDAHQATSRHEPREAGTESNDAAASFESRGSAPEPSEAIPETASEIASETPTLTPEQERQARIDAIREAREARDQAEHDHSGPARGL